MENIDNKNPLSDKFPKEDMINFKTKEVMPYGYLKTYTGDTYILLAPFPLEPDSWQIVGQQRWTVTPLEPIAKSDGRWVYSYARDIVCSPSYIEYRAVNGTILVWMCDFDFDINSAERNYTPSEDNEESLANKVIYDWVDEMREE